MADSKKTIARKTLSTKRAKKQNNSVISAESLNIDDSSAEVKRGVVMANQQQQTDQINQLVVKPKTGLHFTDGEKGGVGKSLFCRALLEYCISKGLSDRIQFVESDVSNPDVGTIYFNRNLNLPNYHEVEFTRDEKTISSADKIFELAIEKSVIVNLPSNIYGSVSTWLKQNNIFTLAKENNVQIYKWFVCNGGHSSLDKFKESVNEFHEQITHIFVRNQVIFDDWTSIEQDEELKEILTRKNVFQMDFPQFSFEERNRVDAGQLTFSQALADDSGFGILSKQRIRNFLNDTYKELDRLNLLP